MEAFDEYERTDDNKLSDEELSDDNKLSDEELSDELGGGYMRDFGLQDGFADLQRTSRADDCGGLPIIMSGNLSDLNKKINEISQDPVDRFKRQVGAISHSITEDGLYNISVDDRNKMCRMTLYLDNVKYLNATAYILGFVCINGGKTINKNIIEKIFNILHKLKDESVKPADVVRYARFWLNQNMNI